MNIYLEQIEAVYRDQLGAAIEQHGQLTHEALVRFEHYNATTLACCEEFNELPLPPTPESRAQCRLTMERMAANTRSFTQYLQGTAIPGEHEVLGVYEKCAPRLAHWPLFHTLEMRTISRRVLHNFREIQEDTSGLVDELSEMQVLNASLSHLPMMKEPYSVLMEAIEQLKTVLNRRYFACEGFIEVLAPILDQYFDEGDLLGA